MSTAKPKFQLRRTLGGISTPLAGLLLIMLTPLVAQGATYTVNNNGDSATASCPSNCTLRAAIRAANGNAGKDTITLPNGGATPFTVNLTRAGTDNTAERGDLDITDDLDIIGLQEGGRNIINAGGISDRVFHILGSASVTMQNVSIRNGAVTNAPGAGIYVSNSATLELTNAEVRGNTVTFDPNDTSVNFTQVQVSGGGIHVDQQAVAIIGTSDIVQNSAPGNGGISNAGRTEIRQSLIDGNTASAPGGNSTVRFSNGGGIGNLGGYLTMGSSTVSNNRSNNQGGGIYIINQGLNLGLVTITNSAITGNEALFNGAGIANFGPATLNNSVVANNLIDVDVNNNGGNGAGIYNHAANANLDVVNSTVSGNSGAYSGGGIFNSHDMTLHNTTLYDNHAQPCASGCLSTNSQIGGNQLALFRTSASNAPNLILANSIVVDGANSNPNEPACAGTTNYEVFIQSIGNSMSSDASCDLNVSGGDLVNVTTPDLDPDLTTSTDVNGTAVDHTGVHALLAGSPARDAGNTDTCPDVDQRFMLRDLNCDIGAYEYGATQQRANIYVDLKASINDSPDPAPPNVTEEPLTYVVTITNQYVDITAENVTVVVNLPASYQFSRVTMASTGSPPSCDEPTVQNVLTCTISNLPGLGRAEFFISGIPTQEGTITASVNVSSQSQPDAFSQNNRDSEDTVIDPEAADVTNFNGGTGGSGGGSLQPIVLLLLLAGIALLRGRGRSA